MIAFLLRVVSALVLFLVGINQLHASKHAIWWVVGLFLFVLSFLFESIGPAVTWGRRQPPQ